MAYDENGRVMAVQRPEGTVSEYGYEQTGQVKEAKHQLGVSSPQVASAAVTLSTWGRDVDDVRAGVVYTDQKEWRFGTRVVENLGLKEVRVNGVALEVGQKEALVSASVGLKVGVNLIRLRAEDVAGGVAEMNRVVVRRGGKTPATVGESGDSGAGLENEPTNPEETSDLGNLDNTISSSAKGRGEIKINYEYEDTGLIRAVDYSNIGKMTFGYDGIGRLTRAEKTLSPSWPLAGDGAAAPWRHEADPVQTAMNAWLSGSEGLPGGQMLQGEETLISGDAGATDYEQAHLSWSEQIRQFLQNERYVFDTNGNRVEKGQRYDNNNQLIEDALARYGYDRNGNLTQKTHKQGGLRELFAYDTEGHLVGYELRSGQKVLRNAAYMYDGLGQRVGKLVDPDGEGLSRSYFIATLYADENLTGVVQCDEAGERAKIPAIQDGKWSGFSQAEVNAPELADDTYPKTAFTDFEGDGHQKQVLDSLEPRGCFVLAAVVQSDTLDSPQWFSSDVNKDGLLELSESYTVIQDHLGSVVALTNAQGNIEAQYAYDSFGNFAVITSAGQALSGSAVPEMLALFTYTGRSYDPESGLFHYRARAYDAKTGRFLQEDPVWDVNLYAYVGNSPVNFVDPRGKTAGVLPAPDPGLLIGLTLGGSALGGAIGGLMATTIAARPIGPIFGLGLAAVALASAPILADIARLNAIAAAGPGYFGVTCANQRWGEMGDLFTQFAKLLTEAGVTATTINNCLEKYQKGPEDHYIYFVFLNGDTPGAVDDIFPKYVGITMDPERRREEHRRKWGAKFINFLSLNRNRPLKKYQARAMEQLFILILCGEAKAVSCEHDHEFDPLVGDLLNLVNSIGETNPCYFPFIKDGLRGFIDNFIRGGFKEYEDLSPGFKDFVKKRFRVVAKNFVDKLKAMAQRRNNGQSP